MTDTRRNVVALGLDYALFFVALSFASPSTILPAFAAFLGAPNVVIGAIPAVMTAGWNLPSLFMAAHTETLERKLPWILRYTIWERVPFLGMAAIAFFLAERAPATALAALLLMLLVMTGTGGLVMPAWMDLMGRAIPTSIRGRFFGIANMLANLASLGGSLIAAWILARIAAPTGYGVCFLVTTLFMALSYVAFTAVREPPAVATAPPTPLGTYLRRIPSLLQRDPNLSWYLLARACGAVGLMGSGFYTVYALRTLDVPLWYVGIFTAASQVGQIAGNVGLGWLADRGGHRRVVMIGAAATVAASALALTAPAAGLFSAVFALMGVQVAAGHVSGMNVLLEFAPRVEERPTYVGLGNTLYAPPAIAAYLGAGVLADTLGFRAVFVAAALFSLAALAVLMACVRDPRHAVSA
ncbi:MAG: MFS transporter [Candidatus Rokubacteria bacterium]|nr:MFS transporter [Candidatus Rokubacteria bacterium]MBI3825670.1 MFS transporter [Candidatus Rokubacteria bacterium]